MKKFKLIFEDPSIMKKTKRFTFLHVLIDFRNSRIKFLQEYVLLHGIPRAIRLDQARCQTGQQIKAFCSQNNIQLTEAPIHDHRAIGLVERLIQTIKNRLACIKTAAQNQFNVKASINSIIYQLRICRQKTINISPFEAHFGRKANTPLSNITTKPDPKSLTRWVDRLLPVDFSIDHLPGTKMGLVDYISRDPQQQAANISAYDEQFIVAKLDVIKRSAKRSY